MLSVIHNEHPLRSQTEAMIRDVYLREHGARIEKFPALLVVKSDTTGVVCAASLRFSADGFFSECYLDSPIEQVIGGHVGQAPNPTALVEVGSLVASHPGDIRAFTQYPQLSYIPEPPAGATIDLEALYQGGHGIVVTNGGYAQLVSIFTICANIGVLAQNGGTCSITNSNTDFGNYGLWSDGVSALQYTANIDGGNQGPNSFLIKNLPLGPDGVSYKKPYVGQVVTIGDAYFYINRVDVIDTGLGYDINSPPRVLFEDPLGPGGIQAEATVNLTLDPATGTYRVTSVNMVVSGNQFLGSQFDVGQHPNFLLIDPPPPGPHSQQAVLNPIAYPIYYTVTESTPPNGVGQAVLTVDESLSFVPVDNAEVRFYQVSRITAASHSFEYVGTGTDIVRAIPARGGVPIQPNEVVQTAGGRVAFTSTDHLGNFRIGTDLVINQNNGTLSGRTFQKSLFALMTPYMLAIEGS